MTNMKKQLLCIWIILNYTDIASCAYTPAMETTIRAETVLDTTSYDAVSRPKATTNVKVGVSILAIGDLDLKSQKLTANGWLKFEWLDDRLHWTPSNRGNIETVFAKPDTIWKPELIIDNSLDNAGVIKAENLSLRYTYQGKVEWEPFIAFTTHCESKCSIDVVSWGYTDAEITLDPFGEDINLEDFQINGEWKVMKTKIKTRSLIETKSDGTVIKYPQLKFWIYIERRVHFSNLNVLMPIFLESLLVVLVFIVPVESGEKIAYVLTVLLSLAVLMTLVAETLPPISITTSILGLYLGTVLVTAAVGVLLTVVVIKTYNTEGHPNNPSAILGFTRFAARITCHKRAHQRPSSGKIAYIESVYHPNYSDFTWVEVSIILDRLCFYCFTAATILMNCFFVIVLVVGGIENAPA